MLAIRMQRRGRKGHAQFRVILQDSHRSPSTGKVVAHLGSFDPHTKQAQLDKEKIDFYLKNGAQPSNRVARLLQKEGVELPSWVKVDTDKKGTVKNPEKYGSEEAAPAAPADDKPTDEPAEANDAADAKADDTAEETPADDTDAEK